MTITSTSVFENYSNDESSSSCINTELPRFPVFHRVRMNPKLMICAELFPGSLKRDPARASAELECKPRRYRMIHVDSMLWISITICPVLPKSKQSHASSKIVFLWNVTPGPILFLIVQPTCTRRAASPQWHLFKDQICATEAERRKMEIKLLMEATVSTSRYRASRILISPRLAVKFEFSLKNQIPRAPRFSPFGGCKVSSCCYREKSANVGWNFRES